MPIRAAIGLLFTGFSIIAAAAVSSPRTVWDGVFSPAQVARGKKAYESLCRRCHGETLGGGEDSPAVAGQDFLSAWYGKSVGELVAPAPAAPSGPSAFARPKSRTFTVPSLRTLMFAGFRSR